MLRGGRKIEEEAPHLVGPPLLAKPERRDRAPQLDLLPPGVPGIRVQKASQDTRLALYGFAKLRIGLLLVEGEGARVEKCLLIRVEPERGLRCIPELVIAFLGLELGEELSCRAPAPGIAAVLELDREHAPSHPVQLQLAVDLGEVECRAGTQAGHLLQVEVTIVEMAQKVVVPALESFCKGFSRCAPDFILLRARRERCDEDESQAEQARRGPNVGCGYDGLVLLRECGK